MRIRQVVILVALILIVTILTGYYLNLVSIYYLVPVVFVFLLITILGSINICWNYFFVSHCHRNTNEKVIAITFDDGPDPVKTPELLTVLDKHQVKVAFFLIGNKVNANKQLVVNINQKGHVIGNHSYTHSNYFDLFYVNRIVNEIDVTNNDIYKLTGVKPLLFRPPFGVTNPLLKKAILKTGMVSIGWSLRSLDTVKDINSTFEKLVRKTKPGDVVLFHDTIDFIPELIDKYISWLNANNYRIVGLDELFKINVYDA